MVRAYGAEHGCEVDCFQSNHEGAFIDRLHAAHGNYDGIVYNPGAHTHYSYALHDAVECIDVPVVEIHISDISKREEFRRTSVIAPACIAQVKGLGKEGYLRALDILLKTLWPKVANSPMGVGRRCDGGVPRAGCPQRTEQSVELFRRASHCLSTGCPVFSVQTNQEES